MAGLETHVSVEEDGTNLLDDVRGLVRNNKTVLLVIVVVGVGLYINRAMLRRELKHINFSFEMAPSFDDIYGADDIIDDEMTRAL